MKTKLEEKEGLLNWNKVRRSMNVLPYSEKTLFLKLINADVNEVIGIPNLKDQKYKHNRYYKMLKNKFTVFKNKDIKNYLDEEAQDELKSIATVINDCRYNDGKFIIDCVVIESNHPIYNDVVKMLMEHEKK